MTVLVLRVECHGTVLGEFPLQGEPLVLRLQDGESGRVVTTLTLEPGQPVRAAQPPRTGFGALPPLAVDGNLYQDETVDLVLSNEDTLAKGIARIREAARGSQGTINVQLPPSQGEPELLELSEPSQSADQLLVAKAAPIAPSSREESDPGVGQQGSPGPRPGRDSAPPMEPEASPELTEQDAPALVPGLPTPEHDRSVTRTLSNGLVDLLEQAEREARAANVARPTVTEAIASDEAGRVTSVDSGLDDVDVEGPPTRVSSEPFIPRPIAPEPPPEGSAPGSEDTRVLTDSESGTILPVDQVYRDVGTDFAEDDDEPVTVVAQAPGRAHGRRPLARGEYDELPVGRGRSSNDDLSLGMPQDPSLVGPRSNYDELPVPEQDQRRDFDDDLSLSMPYDAGLTDASIADLSLPVPASEGEYTGAQADPSLSLSLPMPAANLYEAGTDDDITLPLPEESESAGLHEPLAEMVGEPTVSNAFAGLQVNALAAPQPVTPRLLDTTAGFDRDPSTERLEGAEVWFRRGGEWTPRGALNLGQHVQAFGGMVRCDDNGGLVVLAGPRLHGSATMPSGELRQIGSGQQAVHLPPGTSVILWQGEQGIYVRSNVASDASGPMLDQGPVVYRRPPRSQTWRPPASDLDET